MGRRGDGGPDWGNIDWQNFDIRQLGGRGGRIARPPARRSIAVIVVLVLIFLIPIVFSPLVAFLTDLLWFRSLGLEDVYLRRYTAGFWAFIAFLLMLQESLALRSGSDPMSNGLRSVVRRFPRSVYALAVLIGMLLGHLLWP